MTDQRPKSRTLFTDTFLIAAMSSFSYAAAFLYEKGYCDHFGIPTTFISPSITNIFTAAMAMFGFFALVFTAVLPFIALFRKPLWSAGESVLGSLAMINVGIVAIFISGLVSYGFSISLAVLTTALFLIYNTIFLMPILRPKTAKLSWSERVKLADEQHARAQNLFEKIVENTIGIPTFLAICLAGLFLLIAHPAGTSIASHQKEYLMLEDHPDHAVLRTYGTTLIASKVDKSLGLTGANFLILNTSEINDLKLSAVKLGRLKRPAHL